MNDKGKRNKEKENQNDNSNLNLDHYLDHNLVQENLLKDKNKKLKAAIMGVLYYLQQQEEENNSKSENQWALSGRKVIMRNREMVQRRGIRR